MIGPVDETAWYGLAQLIATGSQTSELILASCRGRCRADDQSRGWSIHVNFAAERHNSVGNTALAVIQLAIPVDINEDMSREFSLRNFGKAETIKDRSVIESYLGDRVASNLADRGEAGRHCAGEVTRRLPFANLIASLLKVGKHPRA